VALKLSNSALAFAGRRASGQRRGDVATGRSFVKMGKKMLSLTPLVFSSCPNDSVLGSLSAAPADG